MDPAQWLAAFRITHEQSKKGALSEGEHKKYLGMRDELARSLMNAQGLVAPTGTPPRRVFRVAQVFPIEIENVQNTTTRDLSCAGFTASVTGAYKPGQVISWVLTLSRTTEPIAGLAEVVSSQKTGTNTRLTCNFTGLLEPQAERIETALFDAALARFG